MSDRTISRRQFIVRGSMTSTALLLAACTPAAPPASPTAAPAAPPTAAPTAAPKPAAAPTTAPAAAATAAPKPAAAPTVAPKPAAAPTTPPAAAAAAPKRGGTLVLGQSFDAGLVDPGRGTGGRSLFFTYQVHDRLITAGTDLKLKPGLAEKWEIAPDQLSATFTLRRGVTYQDGTPFDAESVKWNIERYLTDPKSVHTGDLASIQSVEAVDPQTARFRLKEPFSPLLAVLASNAGLMCSRKEVESQGEEFGTKPHKGGTGAFMLEEMVANDHVTLVRNPNWWGRDQAGGQLPYLDRVLVRVFPDSSVRYTNLRTGNVQAIYEAATQDIVLARGDSSLVVKDVAATTFNVLIPNHAPDKVFSEPRYVKAVSMAVDRAELVAVATQNTARVAFGPIAPSHFAYDPAFAPYKPDIEGARSLINAVGKGPLTFEILYTSGDPALLQTLQLLQAQLKKADITANLRGVPSAQWSADFNASNWPGMVWTGIGTGNVDPDVRIFDFAATEGRLNKGAYSNAEVDRLLNAERRVFEEAQRTPLLRKAQEIATVDDPVNVWIMFLNSYVLHSKGVMGLDPHPVERPTFTTTWLAG